MSKVIDEIGTWDMPMTDAFLDTYQKDPKAFLRDILGVTNTWEGQDEIMRRLVTERRITVPSGHALGKDYISAAMILWFLFCHRPSIVIATAPTDRQVGAVIWGEVTTLYHAAKMKLGGRLLDKYLEVDDHEKWYAIGFTTKDARRSGGVGKFQGFHAPNVLIIFSEAQAIEEQIWEQAESLMTASHARFLAIGNPLVSYGKFFSTLQPKSGWHKIRLDCEDSPNVKSGKEIIPGLCSKEWVDEMARTHGVDSPTYMSKVKGIPPKKSEDSFIDGAWIEWANTYGMDAIEASGQMVVGVDPASFGSAKTIITIRRGMKVVEVKKFERKSTMETVGEIVKLLNAGAWRVYLDVTGVGTGIYDRLVELGFEQRTIAVNFGARPVDPPGSENLPPEKRPSGRYDMLCAQMYARVADFLEYKKIAFPHDDDLSLQLISRKMLLRSDGKMSLESKKDYAARGYASPDEADSLVLAFCDIDGMAPEAIPYTSTEEDAEIGGMFSA